MNLEPGTRVGAIESASDDEVRFFGYGVYEGEFPPDLGTSTLHGPVDEEMQKSYRNPRIRLDSGKVVWGCECWWGPEDEIRSMIGKRRVVPAPMPER